MKPLNLLLHFYAIYMPLSGHDAKPVPEGTHAPELDACRPRAGRRRERDHGAEFRSRQGRGRPPGADADEARAGRSGHPVFCGRWRCGSPRCAIIAVDVAFQRIVTAHKFCINTTIPLGIYLPLSTSAPRVRGFIFLRCCKVLQGAARSRFAGRATTELTRPAPAIAALPVGIDTNEQPRETKEHRDNRRPLSNFIHSTSSMQPKTCPIPDCNYRTYCEHRTDRVHYFFSRADRAVGWPFVVGLSNSGLPNPGRRS